MRKKISWLWVSVSSVAMLSAAVLGTGFSMSLGGGTGDTASQPPVVQADAWPTASAAAAPTKQHQPVLIVALGDSLTKGIGDNSGKGYVGALQDKLTANGQTVNVQNLGISGLESTELMNSLNSGGIADALKGAKVITISIGANDMTHSIGGIAQVMTSKGIEQDKLLQSEAKVTKNVESILKTVRGYNKDAPILLLGLYNPFEGVFEDQALITKLLAGWNAQLLQIAQAQTNVKVVPTADIFQWNVNSLLSVDHFHPNQQGYEKIAERMLQALPQEIQTKK
jgi:lysophospholipase L1-like esterase